MSIQAVAWALEQDLPQGPKLVLVSLANHANHTDGYCWLKAETIGREASCSARSVFRYVGGLVRNGYVRKSPRKGDNGKQRANDYWLLFGRPEAAWDWGAQLADDGADQAETETLEAEGEPQDVVEPPANLAHGETAPPSATAGTRQPPDIPPESCGPSATAGARHDAEPSKTKPEDARTGAFVPRAYRPPPEPPPQPVGSVTGAKAEMIFVFDGTPAYEAWAAVMARRNGINRWHLTSTKVVNGEARRGWYFPTLFPPKAKDDHGTDPPKGRLATEDELTQFGKTG